MKTLLLILTLGCIWQTSFCQELKLGLPIGHTDGVISATFSNNGKKVITASIDHTARIWDAASGKLLNSLEGHTDRVESATFSSDATKVITASRDNTARIWDAASGKLLHTFKGHKGSVTSATFSSNDTKVLTAAWDNTARIWDSASGKLLHTFKGHKRYVLSATFSSDDTKVLTASGDKTSRIWDVASGKLIHTLEGHTEYLTSATFSSDDQKVLTLSLDSTVIIWDAASGTPLNTLGEHKQLVTSTSLGREDKKVITLSDDKTARIWDAASGKLLHTLEGHTDRVESATFSSDATKVITASRDKTARIWDAATGKLLQTLEGHKGWVYSATFSYDDSKVLTAAWDNTARIWDAESGKLLHTLKNTRFVTCATFSSDDTKVLTASDHKTARIWDAASGKLLHTLEGHTKSIQFATFSSDETKVLTASWDKTARIWDAASGKLLHTLEGHTSDVRCATFSSDETKVLTASKDGSIILWDSDTGEQLIRAFQFDSDPNKWVHLHPSGLFNASPEAMEMMYWTKGLEVIEFAQLKDRYYLPGLWEKVMKGEVLPNVRDMNHLTLQPEVTIGNLEKDKLPITLTKRDGGYGKVSIWINGKEAINDARGSELDTTQAEQTIYYSIKDHPYLRDTNVIEIKASSADGFVQGRGVILELIQEQKAKSNPNFYGIIVGIDDYSGNIDLKYPGKDAQAIAKAIELGAENLFGTEKQFVYAITSQGKERPNKENIQKVFYQIAKKAKAEDVLFVYLSGHGITWGGDLEGDFHFLTADATAAYKEAYNDPAIRAANTVSTAELIEWIKEIPALKQVMVIDACGSGKAVDNLIAARDVEASQIRAIDRMKDRTGMFIISGCAADAVSYEASQYGQGLLTYSILQGMKGAALKENKFVDVYTILNHARESVPKLAEGLGGIQTPQLLIPKGGSFDIGILEEKDKKEIPLAEPKKVYIRTIVVDKKKYKDVLELSKRLNDELSMLSAKGSDTEIVFWDSDEYSNSCQITGGYSQNEKGISIDLAITCGEDEKEYTLNAKDVDALVKKILELVN